MGSAPCPLRTPPSPPPTCGKRPTPAPHPTRWPWDSPTSCWPRGGGLAPMEWVIEGEKRGAHWVCGGPRGRTDRGLAMHNHVAEDVREHRKAHAACVLLLGGPGKPGIALLRAQDALQRATHHDRSGTFLHQTCAHVAQHGGLLLPRACVEGLEQTESGGGT